MAIFCLLFVLIGGVSASDVSDMSNDWNNNEIVGDSLDLLSEGSLSTSLSDQSSDADVSSEASSLEQSSNLGISALSQSADDESNLGAVDSSSSETPLMDNSSSDNSQTKIAKQNASLKISDTKILAGSPATVTLRDGDGNPLKGKKILFTLKNKVYSKTTNSKGQAKLTFNKIGTYKLNIKFEGDDSFLSSELSSSVKVSKSSTSLALSKSTVPRSTSYVVTLKNKDGNPVRGKTVRFVIPERGNKTYVKVTDSKGHAKLVINSKNKFILRIVFAGDKSYAKSSRKTAIKPIICKTKIICPSGDAEFGSGLVVTLRKKVNNWIVKNETVVVKITNKNKSFKLKTNSKGQVSIPLNYLGKLDVKVTFATHDRFSKSSANATINVAKGATEMDAPSSVGKGYKYVLTLKNSAGKALANKKVKITFKGKTFTKTTNSKGQVSLAMDYKKGSYSLVASYSGDRYYNSSKVSKKIKIEDPSISISKIIAAAKDLKTRAEYINLLNKSYTVSIDGKKFTMDEFAYLMSGAITHINSGSKANVKIKDLSNNYKSKGAKINGKLSKKDYLKLANLVTKDVNSKNCIPSYGSSSLGNVEADLYIYAFTKVLDSYSKNKKLPSSVKIKTANVKGGYSYSISQGGKILNCREIFDSDSFAKYLKTGGKSALNSAIKKKAKSLTAGLNDPLSKAIAIFRYVRDDVSYSFYTNSRKGASGTYSSKSGNCCDKANLIVAMCRSVGVYSRYSHAQGCKFQSGLYTGHVWAQVYDTRSQTWYTADATSFRNEVGNIKNWNTKSHYRDKTYTLIPF